MAKDGEMKYVGEITDVDAFVKLVNSKEQEAKEFLKNEFAPAEEKIEHHYIQNRLVQLDKLGRYALALNDTIVWA